MHYPLEIPLGAARINAHLIFEMLAYTAGYQVYIRLRRRSADRISDEHRNWILLGAAAGAFLGSHLALLALAIGRIGCHFAGLDDGTQGLPSALPWAVDFGDGIPRHPVNLYEILLLGGTALLLRKLEKNGPLADGLRFKIFMIVYLAWRFVAEWLKPAWYFPFGLSSIQIAALAGLIYYRKTIVSLFKPLPKGF